VRRRKLVGLSVHWVPYDEGIEPPAHSAGNDVHPIGEDDGTANPATARSTGSADHAASGAGAARRRGVERCLRRRCRGCGGEGARSGPHEGAVGRADDGAGGRGEEKGERGGWACGPGGRQPAGGSPGRGGWQIDGQARVHPLPRRCARCSGGGGALSPHLVQPGRGLAQVRRVSELNTRARRQEDGGPRLKAAAAATTRAGVLEVV